MDREKSNRLQNNGEVYLRFIRPGTEYKAIINKERNSVKVSKYKHDNHRTVVLFHRIEGYGGGWLYDIYVFMMDLSGIALILVCLYWNLFLVEIDKAQMVRSTIDVQWFSILVL